MGNELQITYRKASELVPYARNTRTHTEEQIAKVASSIGEFGFTNPILVDGENGVIAGHCRLAAAQRLGIDNVPTIELAHLSEAQRRAYVIADNKLAEEAGWDEEFLALELGALADMEFDTSLTGLSEKEIATILQAASEGTGAGLTEDDDTPEVQEQSVSATGDIWRLSEHRVMCGDSTNPDHVAALMNGRKATLLHADPPYGMGKEGDGVANDNLYRDKLDAFQMAWWRTFRPHLEDNGSAYIWGNASDLWRLWYLGGLADSEYLEMRNHITWDKKSIAGMKSDLLTQYPIASEHCLFFQIGRQFLGNINTEDYWDGWDEIRLYLKEEADACGLTPTRMKEICGVGMYSHWFTKSQWHFIPEKHYAALAAAFPGNFTKPYRDLRKLYDQLKGGFRAHFNGLQGGMRAYFDNAHDVMRDVWEFPRVTGDERHGHATPKPVAMMERVMRSSLHRGGGLCRAIRRFWLHPDRRREGRPHLLRHGADAALRGRDRSTLAGLHRKGRHAGAQRKDLRGGRT